MLLYMKQAGVTIILLSVYFMIKSEEGCFAKTRKARLLQREEGNVSQEQTDRRKQNNKVGLPKMVGLPDHSTLQSDRCNK